MNKKSPPRRGYYISTLEKPISPSLILSGREGDFKGVGVETSAEVLTRHPINDLGILPVAKSSFDQFVWIDPQKFSETRLPGHGEPYFNCGHIVIKGCLDVEKHKQSRIDGVDVSGKIFVNVGKRTCFRADCPICYEAWAGKQAHKIEYRLKQYRLNNFRPIHFVVSPPKNLHYKSLIELRKKAYIEAKNVKFLGGSCITHHLREVCKICGGKKDFKSKRCLNCGAKLFGWYYSPHFHMIGYGYIKNVKENYEKTGWVTVNMGVRDSVFATAHYQLSHACISDNHHTVTWFGLLSYNKFHPRAEVVEKAKCPLCGGELFDLTWIGEGNIFEIITKPGNHYLDPGGWKKDGFKVKFHID